MDTDTPSTTKMCQTQSNQTHLRKLKDLNKNYDMKWNILDRAPDFNPVTRKCRLCLKEIFGSVVSREPYKSLDPFFCCSALLLCSSFATNFEACYWLKWFIRSSDWLTILRPGWWQVAVQYSTNSWLYEQCSLNSVHWTRSVQFCSAWPKLMLPSK